MPLGFEMTGGEQNGSNREMQIVFQEAEFLRQAAFTDFCVQISFM